MHKNIQIEAAGRTPSVSFDFVNNLFLIEGESYPEDVNEFYGPIMTAFTDYLQKANELNMRFEVRLVYFNSTSARILFEFFERLEEAAKQGNRVKVVWSFAKDDDNMEEFGEEFQEDVEAADFVLAPF